MTTPNTPEGKQGEALSPCPWCDAIPVKTDLAPSQRYRLDHKPTCYLYGRMTSMRGNSRYIFIGLNEVEKWNSRRASVAAVEDETGWLLEKMHNGNVHYICADYVLQWTDDPNKALRLSRREDAEALTTIVEDCEKIAEHGWPAAPSSTMSSQPPSCAFCDSGLVFNEKEIAALSDLYERTGITTAKILKHALALYQSHIVQGWEMPLESKLAPAPAQPEGEQETNR